MPSEVKHPSSETPTLTVVYLFWLATPATWLWSKGRAGGTTEMPGAHHRQREDLDQRC